MAIRFYLHSDLPASAPAVTPSGWSAGWDDVSGAAGPFICAPNVEGYGTLSNFAETGDGALSGAGAEFIAWARWVSPPLEAQTISAGGAGTLKGVVRCGANSASLNATLAIAVKVIQSDGSDRGVLCAVSASDNTASTPPEIGTGDDTRRFQDSAESTDIALAEVVCSAGDRIVIETGMRELTTSTSLSANMLYGRAALADFAHADQLGGEFNPWVEFSDDITFTSESIAVRTTHVAMEVAYLGSDDTPVRTTHLVEEVAIHPIVRVGRGKGEPPDIEIVTTITTDAALVGCVIGTFDTTDADRVIDTITYDGDAMNQAVTRDDATENLTSWQYWIDVPDDSLELELNVQFAGEVTVPLLIPFLLPNLGDDPVGATAHELETSDATPDVDITTEENNSILIASFMVKGTSLSTDPADYLPTGDWEFEELLANSTTEVLVVTSLRITAQDTYTAEITVGTGTITNTQMTVVEYKLAESIEHPDGEPPISSSGGGLFRRPWHTRTGLGR